MTPPVLDNLSPVLALLDAQAVRYVVCGGLIALTCCLRVLARTQWGHSNPLRKCIVLSLVAHLLVGIYLTTVHIVAHGPPGGAATSIVLVDGSADDLADAAEQASSGNLTPSEATPDASEPGHSASAPATDPAGTQTPTPPAATATAPPTVVPAAQAETPNKPSDASETASAPTSPPSEPAETPVAAAPLKSVAASDDIPPPEPSIAQPQPLPPAAPFGASANVAPGKENDALEGAPAVTKPTPRIYDLRTGHDHVRVAELHGGGVQTEAAVGAALQYLVASQSIDGRWNPRALEGGRQMRSDGPDRQGVGMQADTGLTGLCLLSLLAAGHTHLQGEYQDAVKHGLEFLLGAQAADGNLSGVATLYERMYCHGMAAFALSEALAMTGDERLKPAVQAAIAYTLRAQCPGSGGWRYKPGEPGDMSQSGWQAMALKSAALGGVAIPDESRAGMQQFLQSIASGPNSGLAAYRPGHQPTRTMTAEALVCRQFMGVDPATPQSREAANFVMTELPGDGQPNVYYWYYGTLGMYQMQGVYWQRWNTALQKQLLTTQRRDGALAGSWNPDPVWGGYGGRAFSTALSALCLEVYYRFLPLYAAHADAKSPPR